MTYNRCCFSGCKNTNRNTWNLSFHKVHKTKHSSCRDLNKWKEVCRVEQFDKFAMICGVHFDDAAFINPKNKSQGLIASAIPSRNPKPLPFETVIVEGSASNVPSKVTAQACQKPDDTKSFNSSPNKTGKVSNAQQDKKQPTKVLRDSGNHIGLGKQSQVEKFIPITVKPSRKITLDLLCKITCRMCLRTTGGGHGMSAFSPFAGEKCLADIAKICFGIRIRKKEFCTNICDACLVKVDIVWRLYVEYQSHRLAMDEFYGYHKVQKIKIVPVVRADSVKVDDRVVDKGATGDNPEEDAAQNDTVQDDSYSVKDPPPVKKRKKKANSEFEDSDSDTYSLPEHPFFTNPTKKPYLCHLCPKKFSKETLLDNHLIYKHRNQNHDRLCEFCAKIFHQYKFSNHLAHHLEQKQQKSVVCPTCNKLFHNSRNLYRHMFVHTNERPFPCTMCDKRFTQIAYLRFHVQREHGTTDAGKPTCKGGPAKTRIPCPVCGKIFQTSPKLIAHIEQTHPEHPLDVIPCQLCPQRFTSLFQLRTHRLVFHSGKKFECGQCGRVVRSRGQLRTHLQKHERNSCLKGDEECDISECY